MASFGHTENEASSVVIAGGGNIGLLLAEDAEVIERTLKFFGVLLVK